MIYNVRQTTTYDYGSVVPFSRHVARMLPVDRPGQRVLSAVLDITPEPAEIYEESDFFGNRISSFAFDMPHGALEISLTAMVEVAAPAPLLGSLTPTVEQVAMLAIASTDVGPGSPVHHLYPSRAVPLDPSITAYAAKSVRPDRPVLEAASDLMARIKAEFTYEPGATDAGTLPAAAFVAKRGVCQDFAHIMIAGLRGLGVPAAYVSGYLRTDPPPGRPRLEGADATHAWVQVWCGQEAGWIGLDPTNGILAGEDHIVVAVGRDYADVSPIDGVIIASGGHTLSVKVDVVPQSPPTQERGKARTLAAVPPATPPAG